jgi:hypothetical protein
MNEIQEAITAMKIARAREIIKSGMVPDYNPTRPLIWRTMDIEKHIEARKDKEAKIAFSFAIHQPKSSVIVRRKENE